MTNLQAQTMKKQRRARMKWSEVLRRAVLLLIAIPWVAVPMWLLVVNSLKPYTEASVLGLGLPSEWRFDNYAYVFEKGNYPVALGNSLLIALPTLATVIILGSMAAWAFARSRHVSMRLAYTLCVLSILLPPALLPTIFELQMLRLDGSRFGYFLVMVGTRLGVVVFLATGFIRAMPPDLEEAATIDGATRQQVYWLVLMPLLLPVLLVGGVILIITIWNEFFFALFFLRGSGNSTLPVSLFRFATASSEVRAIRWDLVFAHVILTSMPILIVYFFVQRRLLTGLSEGAIKG